jgi:hypothetical protein
LDVRANGPERISRSKDKMHHEATKNTKNTEKEEWLNGSQQFMRVDTSRPVFSPSATLLLSVFSVFSVVQASALA